MLDTAGNVLIADTADKRIRKVSALARRCDGCHEVRRAPRL